MAASKPAHVTCLSSVPLQAPGGGGYQPATWAALLGTAEDGPPLSYEGGPQRCFRLLFVCNDGINISSHGWPLHGLGQRLVEHYSSRAAELDAEGTAGVAAAAGAAAGGQQEQQQGQQLVQQSAGPAARLAAAQAAMQAAEAAALAAVPDGTPLPGNSSSGSREVLLRVVFLRRSSPDRQLLNTAELMAACNGWRHRARGGRRLRAVCWEAEPTDVFSGIAAAQAADVLVGVHGGWEVGWHSLAVPSGDWAVQTQSGACRHASQPTSQGLVEATHIPPSVSPPLRQAPTWPTPGSCAQAAA